MKKIAKRFVAFVLVMVMALLPTSTAFAVGSADDVCDTGNVTIEPVDAPPVDALQPRMSVATLQESRSGGNFTLQVSIPAGKTAKSIYFCGNKNGGGANTTMNIGGSGIVSGATNVPVNGQWYKISSSAMNFTGPSTLTWNAGFKDTSTTYNLAFILYDHA